MLALKQQKLFSTIVTLYTLPYCNQLICSLDLTTFKLHEAIPNGSFWQYIILQIKFNKLLLFATFGMFLHVSWIIGTKSYLNSDGMLNWDNAIILFYFSLVIMAIMFCSLIATIAKPYCNFWNAILQNTKLAASKKYFNCV